MTDTRIEQPKSGYEFGATTWRCKCGAKQVVYPDRGEGKYFSIASLPLGWVIMSVEIGTPDGLNKTQRETFCAHCAYSRGFGPKPAAPPLPVYAKTRDGRVFLAMQAPEVSKTKRLGK